MFEILDTKIKLIFVTSFPDCDIWVTTPTSKELASSPDDIRFGVSHEKVLQTKDEDLITPYFKLSTSVLLIDLTRDKEGNTLSKLPCEFKIILPADCSLSFAFL